jgi:polysaccharide biosynthesis/export protein PslD
MKNNRENEIIITKKIISWKMTAWRLPFLLGAIVFFSACSTHQGIVIQRFNEKSQVFSGDKNQLPSSTEEFVIGHGDVLRVETLPIKTLRKPFVLDTENLLYIRFYFGRSEYRLMVGDELRVNFLADSKNNFDAVVRFDGMITVPTIGELIAVGKTPAKIAEEISRLLRARMQDPRSTVAVLNVNYSLVSALTGDYSILPDGKILLPMLGEFPAAGITPAQLSENISAAAKEKFGNDIKASVIPRDFIPKRLGLLDRNVTVTSEGDITIPEIGLIKAAGLTLPQLQKKLSDVLQMEYTNPISLSVFLLSSANRTIYVNGQVRNPGAIPLNHNLTMLKAIMQAGGVTPEGNLSEVVLIHYGGKGDITVYKTNLQEVMENNLALQDLQLSPQDVIFVPQTGIAQANQFVDQYINRMLPFSRSVNYNYNKNPDLTQ